MSDAPTTHPTTPAQDARAMAAAVAARLWAGFGTHEKALVRFGMFPAEPMRQGAQEIGTRDAGRLLACALMDCAKADGGMRA